MNEYNRSTEMFHRLREHASVILGVNALILTLVSTILSTSVSENLSKIQSSSYLVLLGLLCFLISASFSLSIFWPRRWDVLLVSPEEIIKLYELGELK
jgi:glucose uptake protein GlcU